MKCKKKDVWNNIGCIKGDILIGADDVKVVNGWSEEKIQQWLSKQEKIKQKKRNIESGQKLNRPNNEVWNLFNPKQKKLWKVLYKEFQNPKCYPAKDMSFEFTTNEIDIISHNLAVMAVGAIDNMDKTK